MPVLLPEPEVQFCDANGAPYAGGLIYTYTPGTSTPKDTWQDSGGTILNTNPIVLDAAGRAIIYGTGDYRFVLYDSAGNLIYDQLTSVDDASSAVAAETTRAEAAEAALGTRIDNEITRATNAENTLTTNLNNEITRATTEENHLQSEIDAINSGLGAGTGGIRVGTAVMAGGNITVTFAPAFATKLVYFSVGTLLGGLATDKAMPPPSNTQYCLITTTAFVMDRTHVIVGVGYDTTPGTSGGVVSYTDGTAIDWYAWGY
jgi:hypothetical protein